MSKEDVTRCLLDNGMVILLKEVHSAPVIAWWVLYRVGSRNEQTGHTGISHWVEHMMFKGTDAFPVGTIDRLVDRAGGNWNAFTSYDQTAYHEMMPADRIDLALRIESDRMVNAKFDPTEVESERTVIISERQGSENSPLFWLREELQAAAFRVHPYRHMIIGDMADLKTITRDDLYTHYKTYYRPNNAIGVVVGAFQTEEMLKQIRDLYEPLPAGLPVPAVARDEPEQRGERRIIVEREGTASYLQYAYHVPAATHEDWIKLAALDSILGGPSGPGSENIDSRTSRLYRALVEKELAVGAAGSLSVSVDPFLYKINLTLRDGRSHEEGEAALDNEINRLGETLVSEAELARAKKQARAAFAYSMEGVSGQAFWLAYSESINSYRWFLDYTERLQAVTSEDIREVAQRYLTRTNRTVGWFVPVRP